jgi:4-amino-4-deoxy-L-arabinose transferase-like glycosyltransferase
LLLLVLVVAATFRFYRLDVLPPGLFFDESLYGIDAAAIARGERFPLMLEVGAGVKGRTREPLFVYLAAGAFTVAGPTVLALRTTAALIGVATVVLFYVLCVRVVGRRTALVAALVLAACQWHVTFSRIGMRAILTPLFMVLTGLALVRLLRARSMAAAALCGATVGLGWYTYTGYWIAPLPLAVVWLLAAWRRQTGWRSELRLAGAAATAFLVVAAPLIVYALTKPDYYFARAVEVAGSVPQTRSRTAALRDDLQRVVAMLIFTSPTPAQFGVPGRALLDPVTATAFVAGLFALCARLREDTLRSAGILAFALCPLLPGASGDMPGAPLRAIGAVPGVCLVAAVGLDRLRAVIAGAGSRWRARAATTGLAVAVTAIIALNGWAYFRVWAARGDVPAAYAEDVRSLFELLAAQSAEADVYVAPYVLHSPNVDLLRLEHDIRLHELTAPGALIAADDTVRDRVFVTESPPLNRLIEELYPRHQVLGRYDVGGRHGGRIYRVPSADLRRTLSPAEQVEVDYWMARVARDFDAVTLRW